MATVRMSEYLKHDIVQTFKKLWEKTTPYPKIDPNDGDALYNRYILPHMEKVENVLKESYGDLVNDFDKSNWTLKENVLITRVALGVDRNGEPQEEVSDNVQRIEIPLSSERGFPLMSEKSTYSHYVSAPEFSFSRSDENFNNVCNAVEDKYRMQASVSRKAKKVRDLLETFTTLNQALKAWPALSKLVPEDKLAKVHEKQQRKRKEAQRKQVADQVVIDNDLNQTILTASLMGEE